MAIQPAQADQPDILTTEKATDDTGRGLWKSLLIWGGIVVGILSIAAVAPLCHYGSRFRPPTFTFSNVTAPPMVQRLVGEFSLPAFLIFFLFLFPTIKVGLSEVHVNNYIWRPLRSPGTNLLL